MPKPWEKPDSGLPACGMAGENPGNRRKKCIKLKLSGNPWGICKYAQEYTKTGR
mgnify:CR=1 FL=1